MADDATTAHWRGRRVRRRVDQFDGDKRDHSESTNVPGADSVTTWCLPPLRASEVPKDDPIRWPNLFTPFTEFDMLMVPSGRGVFAYDGCSVLTVAGIRMPPEIATFIKDAYDTWASSSCDELWARLRHAAGTSQTAGALVAKIYVAVHFALGRIMWQEHCRFHNGTFTHAPVARIRAGLDATYSTYPDAYNRRMLPHAKSYVAGMWPLTISLDGDCRAGTFHRITEAKCLFTGNQYTQDQKQAYEFRVCELHDDRKSLPRALLLPNMEIMDRGDEKQMWVPHQFHLAALVAVEAAKLAVREHAQEVLDVMLTRVQNVHDKKLQGVLRRTIMFFWHMLDEDPSHTKHLVEEFDRRPGSHVVTQLCPENAPIQTYVMAYRGKS